MNVGIIGGGNVGGKLGHLLASVGHRVRVSSRHPSGSASPQGYVATSVADAISDAEVVIIALPYTATTHVLPPLADALTGKVIVDATNPLNDDWSPLALGESTSAGEETARRLPRSRVVKAFNTIFADVMTPERLNRHGHRVTLFIAGDHEEANQQTALLGRDIGFAPLVTGPLFNARYLEARAHLNIGIAVGQGGGTNAAFLYDQASA